MKPDAAQSTVFYDGSCPLCRAEIGHYRRADRSGALSFVDVSDTKVSLPTGLTQRQAMDRFHVRVENGQLLSGARAFAEVWTKLPRWRWVARAAELPGVVTMLEFGYRLSLRVRPLLSKLVTRIQNL